jgi:hypothetical protein
VSDGSFVWFPAESLRRRGPGVIVRGEPRVVVGPEGVDEVSFDGRQDAVILDRHSLEGAAEFSLEAVIRPSVEGATEERVVHLEVRGSSDRVLLETRRTFPNAAEWYADTIVSLANQDAILNTPACRHPVGEWWSLAVVCGGGRMVQYVDGAPEAATPCSSRALGEGSLCVGMRLNWVTPFRGEVLAVRATRRALIPGELWSVKAGGIQLIVDGSLAKGRE